MKLPLNVFFAIGQYFIPYFTVSLTSLLENNKDLNLNIFLIYDFDPGLLTEVLEFSKNHYGIDINLIYQDSKIFENYRIADHVSLNTYLRLLLADIIPTNVDSGLFLDSDTIVTGSLAELATLTFTRIDDRNLQPEKFIFAVREIPEQTDGNSKRISKMGFETDKYFNAGVIMVNLKKWRENNVSKKLIQMASEYMNELLFWDQDILNMYFANQWGELDSKFNALNLIWKRKKPPLIIHYAGVSKPWNYLNRHPYKSYYFKYLKLTPFKNYKYADFALKKVPYKYYRDFRHFLNYYRQIFLKNVIPEAYHD